MTRDYRGIRIAFASLDDATDPQYSSGAPYAIRKGFLDLGCELIDAFPLRAPRSRLLRFQSILHRLNGEYYTADRTPNALRRMARDLKQRIAGERVDFVFSPHSTPVTMLDVDAPIILSHDQTFYERLAYFAYEARPPAKEYVAQALAQEQAAFTNASLCVYPSQRSLDCIATRHDIPRSKLAMIPWGANLPVEPTRQETMSSIRARVATPLRISFVGVDWARKGGSVMVETCRELAARGIALELLVIGCTPPVDLPGWARVIPYLDKRKPQELAEYLGHLKRSHFLFVPSRLEAYGHVFCEAAAFGVPSVTTDVGGIPTIVTDGVTGICLPISAVPADYADAMMRVLQDWGTYVRMADAARNRYETSLNWPAFCRGVIDAGSRLSAAAASGPLRPYPLPTDHRPRAAMA
ncbi:hypothetical protein CLG96_07350 [Sphingomonas oleivorans]|uniref:Glycosyl transferase family 1 domain-containing protein n=1 Tax=Sphingomonas oleivorans TaxID=1735121 RepID=A0A2T5G062_9SPHN|nr:glycosyltransferase family 4 protein [Sphingomonas oleivorans]PTQ12340.1 hypothetical protein CLG96_07350 [Sphingomonas oleivorans]